MAKSNATPYAFYPIIRDDSDEESTFTPGNLFATYKNRKRELATTTTTTAATTTATTTTPSSSGIATTATSASSTTVTKDSTATFSKRTTTTTSKQKFSKLPTSEDWCQCDNCGTMPTHVEKKVLL